MVRILEESKPAIEALCRRFGVRRLDVFGSATGGSFDEATSDFDFLVEFQELPPGERAEAYFGLLEELEALLGRPVDLVVASALKNPFLRDSIEKSRTQLYAA